MITFNCRYLFLVLFFYMPTISALREKAFCAVPIADCSVHCLSTLYEHQDCTITYDNLPLSGKSGPYACPRDQQLLLHEEVTIVDELGDEVQIEVPHLFYVDPDFPTYRKNSFWTLKKNLITLNELDNYGVNHRQCLPYPITDNKNKSLEYNSSIVTLKLPFYDQVTQQTYSAGTRFVASYQTVNLIIVWIFNQQTKRFMQTGIDCALCYRYEPKTNAQKVKDFVRLLTLWANHLDGSIPFVWGGSSFRDMCRQNNFTSNDEYQPHQTISYWTRAECTTHPYAGFDASSLVLRAAQIVGIPYYCKNTYTAHECLQQLQATDNLQDGDIIWLPGGLVVISDSKNNKVIAARGYQTGYGRVVECSLSEFFSNITTFDELKTAYANKKPLQCCTKDGITYKLFEEWSILKLTSVWDYERTRNL